MSTTQRITMIVPEAEANTMDAVQSEFESHLRQAQRYHERALEAHENQGADVAHYRYLALAEQSAAALCQGKLQVILLGALLHWLTAPEDDEEEREVQ